MTRAGGCGSDAIVRHPLIPILLLAAALRVFVTWGVSAHHPDELFQYLEQAHRLVFGYGYVPWEYRDGMRSWLPPVLLAGPMWLGDAIAPDTQAYLRLPRLAVALATLGIVWAAWRVGCVASRMHAVVAAFVAAVWFEQVYYASHTLTETMATAAALPGLALLVTRERDRDLMFAGALLALAALLRFHYAPALAVAVLWHCRTDWRAWAGVAAGAAPVLAVSAAVDLAMGMTPFGWMIANVQRNVIDGVSANYGVEGPLYYLRELGRWWRWGFVPIIFLAVLGARLRPALLAVAVVCVVSHSLIAHKEARFVLLATTLLVILAAIGSAELLKLARERWRAHGSYAVAAGLAAWGVASLALGVTGFMRLQWSNEAPALSAAARAGRDPKLCGVATYGMRYWQSGGYALLHRDVPIYPVSARDELGIPPIDPATLARISGGFDSILTTPPGIADMPPGYERVVCRVPNLATADEARGMAICLYRRAGGCDPAVAEAWRLK